MIAALMVACAVFVGWVLLDFTKTKRVTKEMVLHAFIVAVLGGVVWYVLGLFLGA